MNISKLQPLCMISKTNTFYGKNRKKEVRRTRQVANLIAKESVTNKVKREHWHTDNSAKSFTLPVMKYFFKLEFKELYKLKMGSLNFALR